MPKFYVCEVKKSIKCMRFKIANFFDFLCSTAYIKYHITQKITILEILFFQKIVHTIVFYKISTFICPWKQYF